MRTLTIIEHISPDGVTQVSCANGSFSHGDRDAMIAAHGERFDRLPGCRACDTRSGRWPKAPGSPIADRLDAAAGGIGAHHIATVPA
ncbi:MAG: hypothetical protein JST22_01390 [Bacteroidetes bacterium]|nr:hypothetical protein [Bacteroidota bacterium]